MDISVVIPLFDKVPYVARAVRSVLCQTLAPREIVIVDDGSTDDGPRIIEAMDDPLIRLIRQPNAGVSVARNNGIAACQTPWVALLDADDEWKENFLARVSELIARRPDVICVGTDFTDAEGSVMVGPIALEDHIIDFIAQSTGRGVPVLCSSAIAIRRDALVAAGSFPVGCHSMEDIDTWMRLNWTGNIGFVPEPLAVYHTQVVDSASKLNRRTRRRLPIVVETYAAWELAGRIPPHMRKSAAAFARDWLFRFVRQLIFEGRGPEARATLDRFANLAAGDANTTRKLLARSRVPQAIPMTSRFLKSLVGAYRKPEFL